MDDGFYFSDAEEILMNFKRIAVYLYSGVGKEKSINVLKINEFVFATKGVNMVCLFCE